MLRSSFLMRPHNHRQKEKMKLHCHASRAKNLSTVILRVSTLGKRKGKQREEMNTWSLRELEPSS